jgi:hypothetical protein
MYNSYSGQQPQGQQGYQTQYQVPQQTGYPQPQQQAPPPPQFQQQPQFLPTQATGYGFQSTVQQPGQYGVPPVPPIPTQYTAQAQPVGMQPTGYQPQQFQQVQQLPAQQAPQPTPLSASTTGHSRKTSTAMGTSARIPNGRKHF